MNPKWVGGFWEGGRGWSATGRRLCGFLSQVLAAVANDFHDEISIPGGEAFKPGGDLGGNIQPDIGCSGQQFADLHTKIGGLSADTS